MKHFLLLPLVLLAGVVTASAQPTYRFGLRGGVNRAYSTVAAASISTGSQFYYSASKSAIFAWQAGAVLEVAFEHIALQPALVFSQKGEQLEALTSIIGFAGTSSSQTSTVSRYNWLELPVNVVYTLHGLQVFAGPYVALGVGGRQRGTRWQTAPNVRYAPHDFSESISYGSGSPNRRLDTGANFGIGYRQGPLQVQLGYSLGLRNLHQGNSYQLYDYGHDFNQDAAYNRVAQLTGTYFFKL